MQKAGENNSLYQNLLDAGFNAEKAEQHEKLAEDGDEREKQIDCLDFLVYEINKKQEGEF